MMTRHHKGPTMSPAQPPRQVQRRKLARFTPTPNLLATNRNNLVRGFTLPEIVLVAVLSVALGAVVIEISNASANVAATINGQGTLQLQLLAATNAFDQDARLTVSVPSSCCGTYTQDLDSNDANQRATLILKVSSTSVDANGTVTTIAGVSDYFIYDFDATTGVFQRIVDANVASSRQDETRVVARNLTRVTFTLDSLINPKAVTVDWFARRTEGKHTFDASLVSRTKFRNVP